MEIRSTPIAAIKPYENNPRNNERAVEYVANSIREFGFKQPIVIDSGGVIVAGHTRYLAAQSLGLEAVPCVVADDLTPEQVRAYRLADNKTAELAGWDASKLERELNEIIAGMDMAMFGFAADELDALVSTVADIQGDCDNAPPVMDTVITQPGDIYVLDGKHRVMCGDATNAAHMAMLMDGEKARLIVTDPPYNVDYEGKAGKIANDKMLDADFEKMVVAAFANMRDIAEPGASFYVFHADSNGLVFRQALKKAGLSPRQCLVWAKNHFVMGRQDYQWKHEPILYGWKDGAAHYFRDDRTQTTVIECDRPHQSELHPTMKPVELCGRLIENSSQRDWIVVDLFGGAGSTLIASEELHRRCFTMEIDPAYCDVIIRRYLGRYGGGVELRRNGETFPSPFE